MKTIPLRYLAHVNPPSPTFDQLPADADVLFLPLETVWNDSRADQTRLVPKSQVDSGYTRFEAGDVVSPKVTPTFQAGRSMITSAVGAGTTELHVLRARSGVDSRWVCYAVQSKHFLEQGVSAFQGVAGLQRVPPEFVAGFAVADVSGEEQRRIADFLDDRVARIDQAMSARQRQLALMSDRRDSVADALLPDRAPRVRLGRFVTSIEQGWSPQCDNEPTPPGAWGVLKVGAVQRGWFNPDENKRLPDTEVPKPEYEVRAGDLLVTRANTPERVGFFTVVPEGVRNRLILCDKIMRVALDNALDRGYVSLIGQSRTVRDQFALDATGTSASMVNIRGDDVRDVRISLIALEDQKQLVKRWSEEVTAIDAQSESLRRSIGLLSEYKQSLITAAVTGELDVTSASTRIPGV